MKKLILSVLTAVLCMMSAEAIELKLGTFNIRYSNASDSVAGNGWGQRAPHVAGLIRFHDFDIIGTQEGKYHQLQDMLSMMPGYDYIGVGRDDGIHAGEHSAIFYKTDRFDVVDHGDFWLSETPDRPSKGWDAPSHKRICSWGVFCDKASGEKVLFINLHMDHKGVVARAESARLVLERIKQFGNSMPTIVTGDFNVDQHSEPYALLQNSGVVKDSYEIADFRYAPNGTYFAFEPSRYTEKRIDHLFVNDGFHVKRYGVLTDTYRARLTDGQKASGKERVSEKSPDYTDRTPSDHYPIMIVVETTK